MELIRLLLYNEYVNFKAYCGGVGGCGGGCSGGVVVVVVVIVVVVVVVW